jgi:hypothetical protein
MANLFKDIEDFQEVMPNAHASNDEMLTYASEADDKFIIPFISKDFYDVLVAGLVDDLYDFTDPTPTLTAAQKEVLIPLRKASAYYGSYEAMGHVNVQIGALGARTPNSDESTQVRQWEFLMGRKEAIVKADFYLDKALKIMENDPDAYPTWSESEAYTEYTSRLLTTAADFRKNGKLNIEDSRRLYMKLVPFMDKAVDQQIIDCTGQDLYDQLLQLRSDGEALSAKQRNLLSFIDAALAHYAMYLAAPHLVLDFSDQGIRLVSTQDGQNNKQPNQQVYENWRKELYGDARHYLSRAKKYLDDNAADFPLYENSDAADNNTPDYTIPNHTSKSSTYF